MAQTRNFAHNTNTEFEGVEVAFFTVDFINSMASETSDPAANSNTAGLELARATIGSYINILGEGPLADGNTQKTYILRSDTAPTAAALQTAIRALNGNGSISATISSATVTASDLGILTAAAV